MRPPITLDPLLSTCALRVIGVCARYARTPVGGIHPSFTHANGPVSRLHGSPVRWHEDCSPVRSTMLDSTTSHEHAAPGAAVIDADTRGMRPRLDPAVLRVMMRVDSRASLAAIAFDWGTIASAIAFAESVSHPLYPPFGRVGK